MATLRIPIINAYTLPKANCIVEPASKNFGANDRYEHEVLAFVSQSARQGFAGKFTVPKNYVGTAKIAVVWSTTATSGDVVWDCDYRAVGGDSAESLDPTTDQEAVTGTDTASGTARQRQEILITLTSGNFAVDDEVLFNFFRDAADGADTLAATAYLFSLFFEYADV